LSENLSNLTEHLSDQKFERVLGKKDVLAIGFGAMIGWGWVILAGEWILRAGSLGSMLAFIIGGIMIIFVGQVYAELTSAIPETGGEHVFSYRAFGKNVSYICTWTLILSYAGVAAFEAVALPTVIQYIFPNFLKGYMYTIAGFDVYASWVAVGVIASLLITYINLRGIKTAANLQNILSFSIITIGLVLMAASTVKGDTARMEPLFVDGFNGVLSVAIMTPFMFVGFDVIAQASEEINIPYKELGKIMILSIIMAAAFYIFIIFAIASSLTSGEMSQSVLVTADAMKKVFGNSQLAGNILVLGGVAGIITSWNSFFIGGSRAIYAMAQSKMLPKSLGMLHPERKTPTIPILMIGGISAIAPFFGRAALVWLTNAGGFAIVLAYIIVSLSFVRLRKTEPDLPRPYKVSNIAVGYLAVATSILMGILYLPGMPSGLILPEWIIVLSWTLLGIAFYIKAKKTYPDFGERTFQQVKE